MKIWAGISAGVVIAAVLASVVALMGTQHAQPQPPAQTAIQQTTQDLQTLDITAKGGYFPASSALKAGSPALLRMITHSTFDCSAVLLIPQLGYQTHLPLTGTTQIAIPPQPAGSTLVGTCGMGMYSFSIVFN